MSETAHDAVNHPKHYNAHPGGMECIELVEMLPFCEGNAIKYLWRADHKGARVEDLKKALWYAKRSLQSNNAIAPNYTPATHRAVVLAVSGFSAGVGCAIHALAMGKNNSAAEIIETLIEQAAIEEGASHDA